MERKYYLRGLGVGIAVTAIIMGIALPKNKTMTDDEVKARAKELGMVENTVLSDLDDSSAEDENAGSGNEDSEEDEAWPQKPEETDQEKAGSDEEGKGDGKEAADGGKTSLQQPAAKEETPDAGDVTGDVEVGTHGTGNDTDIAGTGEAERENMDANVGANSATSKTITVNSGDGSHTVARKLVDAGVVTSAEDFDSFMCEHGYDKRLRTGTFLIPADASDEQIARIVTGAE